MVKIVKTKAGKTLIQQRQFRASKNREHIAMARQRRAKNMIKARTIQPRQNVNPNVMAMLNHRVMVLGYEKMQDNPLGDKRMWSKMSKGERMDAIAYIKYLGFIKRGNMWIKRDVWIAKKVR